MTGFLSSNQLILIQAEQALSTSFLGHKQYCTHNLSFMKTRAPIYCMQHCGQIMRDWNFWSDEISAEQLGGFARFRWEQPLNVQILWIYWISWRIFREMSLNLSEIDDCLADFGCKPAKARAPLQGALIEIERQSDRWEESNLLQFYKLITTYLRVCVILKKELQEIQ